MAKVIQICASQNDLFGLDGDGVVCKYNLNTNEWIELGDARSDRSESARGLGPRREEDQRPAVVRDAAPTARPRRARPALAQVRPARGLGKVACALLLAAGVQGGFASAHAEVPNTGHIAACNGAAHEELRGGGASPTPKDEAGAAAARKAGADTADRPGVITAATQSVDPQIHGMGSEGAKNAAYRAAYRVCMRQSGF